MFIGTSLHRVRRQRRHCHEGTGLQRHGTAWYVGDVLVTGTPGGVGFKRNPPVFMKPGDVAEVEISMIGTLINPIADEVR